MDALPAGAVRRSVGGEVPMELTLVRATNHRFPLWIPLLLAFAFVLVAAVPLAAGDGDRPVAASMFVSRTHASPVVEEPQIDVQLNSTRADVVPDSMQNYRVDVTNRGNSTANHVSVVVSVPEAITLVSASRWPTMEDGRLTWILDSLPVGSMK